MTTRGPRLALFFDEVKKIPQDTRGDSIAPWSIWTMPRARIPSDSGKHKNG
jgi:hypothetical protein